jgi:hypothetical protein
MNDQHGLDIHDSSFSRKSFKLGIPRLDLFNSLTMRDIMLAIPVEKLVQLNVMHLMGVVRAAKHEKYFTYLLSTIGRDIGPVYAKTLGIIIKKPTRHLVGPQLQG